MSRDRIKCYQRFGLAVRAHKSFFEGLYVTLIDSSNLNGTIYGLRFEVNQPKYFAFPGSTQDLRKCTIFTRVIDDTVANERSWFYIIHDLQCLEVLQTSQNLSVSSIYINIFALIMKASWLQIQNFVY